jgi:hypothetical protein
MELMKVAGFVLACAGLLGIESRSWAAQRGFGIGAKPLEF